MQDAISEGRSPIALFRHVRAPDTFIVPSRQPECKLCAMPRRAGSVND
jgi:hypothetical protein